MRYHEHMPGAPTETHDEVVEPGALRPRVVGLVVIFSEVVALPRWIPLTEPVTIGRDADSATWVLDDTKASRAHASLQAAPDAIVVRDLDSRNGTYIDGERIAGEVAVPFGSLLRIGRSLILLTDDMTAYQRFPPPIVVGPLIGGPSLDGVRKQLRRLGPSTLAVLIEGETGTGKELAAKMLHRASDRAGPFVAVNCAAIPAQLVESELFGHVRGAFSGSDEARTGLFRQADGGTLFLDEVGELPPAAQAKLLRVIEERRVRPVGADESVAVDIRLVAATHRDLLAMVDAGGFRDDLLHRVAGSTIALPPLRERREDIPIIATHFLEQDALSFSATAMERLCVTAHHGNVRGLRNAVRHAAVNARASGRARVELSDLPAPNEKRPAAVKPQAEARPVDDTKRIQIETALKIHQGNITKVGRDLSISRSSLYELMKRLNIDPKVYRDG